MDSWVDANEKLPEAWMPVQVYIPSQKPLPTVHEGYLETADNDIPFCWRIPALREKYWLYDKNFVAAWKPFSDPPEEGKE